MNYHFYNEGGRQSGILLVSCLYKVNLSHISHVNPQNVETQIRDTKESLDVNLNEASTTIDQILSSIQNFILEKYVVTLFHFGRMKASTHDPLVAQCAL